MSPTELLKNRPSMPWWVELLAAVIIGLAGAADHFYSARTSAQASTLATDSTAVVQTQQKADEQRLDRVDKRLDRFEDKMDHLIEIEVWAHGAPPKRR